jgi:4-oxalocrotonate tautomerase
MPLINVKCIEGVFTAQQKKRIATELTEALVRIEGENLRPATVLIIEEVKSGDWAIGGRTLATGDVRALAAGKSAA